MAEVPQPLPALIMQSFGALVDGVLGALHDAGYDDLRAHHFMHVFRFIDCDGTRPAALAARAGVTAQAMSEILADLESRGYIRRDPDPHDRRSRRVTYAGRGLAAAEVVGVFYATLERQWTAALPLTGLDDVRAWLSAIAGPNRKDHR